LLVRAKVEILGEYKKSRVQLPPDEWGLPAQDISPRKSSTPMGTSGEQPKTESVNEPLKNQNNNLELMGKENDAELLHRGEQDGKQGEVDPAGLEGEAEHVPTRPPIPPPVRQALEENVVGAARVNPPTAMDIAQGFEDERVQQRYSAVRSSPPSGIFDSQPWFAPVQRASGSNGQSKPQGYPQSKSLPPESSNVYLPQEQPSSNSKERPLAREAPGANYSFEPAPMPMPRPLISKPGERNVPDSHLGPSERRGPFQQSSQNPSWTSYAHPKPLDSHIISPRPQNYEPAPRAYPRSYDSGSSFRGRRPPYIHKSRRSPDPSSELERSGGGYSFKGGFTVPNPKSQRDLWGGENPNTQLEQGADPRDLAMPSKKPLAQPQGPSSNKNPKLYIPPALRPDFKSKYKPYMPKPYHSPYNQEPPILERKKGPKFVDLHAVQRPSNDRPPVIRPPQKRQQYQYSKYKGNWPDDG